MAQNVEIHLEDDLDGGSADDTVTFALDGKDYEIDLSTANTEILREALGPFTEVGRKPTRGGARRPRLAPPRTALLRRSSWSGIPPAAGPFG